MSDRYGAFVGEIRFDDELHLAGERLAVHDMRVTNAVAWWISAELIRRHPERLRVIEAHPGGGQYNCVSVFDLAGPSPEVVVHMNLDAGAHLTHGAWFHSEGGGERFNWPEVLLCEDRRSYVVEQIERVEGLPRPSSTPSTESASIGPMLISAFLERSVWGPSRWNAVNGVADSSDGFFIRSELFETVPAFTTLSGSERDFDRTPQYRFWFVGPGDPIDVFGLNDVSFVVDTWFGAFWRIGDAEPTDLLDVYRSVGRSLDALVSETCPSAF